MSDLVNIVIPPLPHAFTYRIPPEFVAEIGVGSRVEIPFGRRRASGYVVAVGADVQSPDPTIELKTVFSDSELERCFLPEQLEFLNWVADYYGESIASVIDVAVPPISVRRYRRTVRLIGTPEEPPRGKLQRAVLTALADAGGSLDFGELTKRHRGASAAIRALAAGGALSIETIEIVGGAAPAAAAPDEVSDEIALSAHQSAAVHAIVQAVDAERPQPFLLHGVTGSGKTEVYIEAIRHTLRSGRGALVIVPEIALTPQLIDRFQARLGDQIAVLHSGLHRRTRWESWRALLEDRCRIAIGARSGIFAPVHNLGLIIVDEEHDGSFKQSEGLRYNGRDLAVVLAHRRSCPVVLGSATPSLESLHHARSKRYHYLALPTRHSTAAPLTFDLVDLNRVKPWEMASPNVSPQLHRAIAAALERREQVFILFNRRGFASYLQCDRCETVVECPNCSVTLTYHQRSHELICHYCNLSLVPSELCSACPPSAETNRGKLVQRGAGTERVYEELRGLFPDAAIDRLDRDAANDLESYKAILGRVRSGETAILVGTQMIAKGHDLPNVTVVGIADCDVGLHMPDFRASERVFQLLTQASGRAGRGDKAGCVVLQTRVPRHPSLVRTVRDDYLGFAEGELAVRQELSYPPFTRLLRIVASSQDKSAAETRLLNFRSGVHDFIGHHQLAVKVLGPSPAPLERLKTSWRWHMILKADNPIHLLKVMGYLRAEKNTSRKVKVTFDMDPQEML
ncbi:MAG: hypothetical protein RL417_2550 [Pseudomonadota bacterium]